MKPADGRYRLTPANPPPAHVDVEVKGNQVIAASLGWSATWVPSEDAFVALGIIVECHGGTFEALVFPGEPNEVHYTGSCTPLP